jgi:multidrug efflux pump subunit AcrA (membrane-fusion protein)
MTLDDKGATMIEVASETMAAKGEGQPPEFGPRQDWRKLLLSSLATTALVLGIVIFWGIRSRVEAETQLQLTTHETAIPSVDVTHPLEGAPTQEIVLPGTTQAFTDTPLYARTNGYLKQWYFDIGARVSKGQLLAEIDTPEVD